jgi:hypothetical protein
MQNQEDVWIRTLADTLTSIESTLTTKERSDLHLLYVSFEGFTYKLDSRNRPQGDTLQSSRTVGSRIRDALQMRGDGMMLIGHIKKRRWCMNAHLRAAIDLIELFPKVVTDEPPGDGAPDDSTSAPTEHAQVTLARIGQGIFRSRVLKLSPMCRITGIGDSRFLRASHIKPWANCTDVERLDGENGLMLAPHVDHLFDKGYISFADDGRMLKSDHLPIGVLAAWSLVEPMPRTSLMLGQARYMSYHRAKVFNSAELAVSGPNSCTG